MRRKILAWFRMLAGVVPDRVGTALLLGAWLALTLLFTVAGSALVLSGVTLLGQPVGLVPLLGAVAGVVAAPALSLTLSRVVVSAAVRRYEAAVRNVDVESGGRELGSHESVERESCQTPLACCC